MHILLQFVTYQAWIFARFAVRKFFYKLKWIQGVLNKYRYDCFIRDGRYKSFNIWNLKKKVGNENVCGQLIIVK